MKKFLLRVPEKRYKEFKKISVEEGKPIYKILNELIDKYIDTKKEVL